MVDLTKYRSFRHLQEENPNIVSKFDVCIPVSKVVDSSELNEWFDWCNDIAKNNWGMSAMVGEASYVMSFVNPEDAIAFKLRFGS